MNNLDKQSMLFSISMIQIKVEHLKIMRSLILFQMLLRVQDETEMQLNRKLISLSPLSIKMGTVKSLNLNSFRSLNSLLIAIDSKYKKMFIVNYVKLYLDIIYMKLQFYFCLNTMLNPQYSSPMITPRQMFSYDRGLNKSWNMSQYKTPRIYQDPKMEVQKRKWATQKKGIKDTMKYVTKRGFYMDYHIKVQKSLPASNVHNSQQPWQFKKQKEKAKSIKVDKSLIKNTYIQQLQREQKNRKKPGVGTYSLQKSFKEKQAQIQALKKRVVKAGQKRYFYQNTQNLSNSVPGCGQHNPHDEIPNIKQDKTNYKYWVSKHSKENQKLKKRNSLIPGSSTYQPLYQSYRSFDLISKTPRKSLEKKNGFGSDSRFPYVRPDKKKIKEVRPAPNAYDTGMKWRGKKDTQKNKHWHEAIYKGSMNESIYN